MASGINNVFLVGNLGRDPELKTAGSGKSYCDMSLAVNEKRKVGENWEDHVEWVNVRVLGRSADNCEKFLRKGSQVAVQGKIETSSWEDKETKQKRYATRVVTFDVTFLGGKGQAEDRTVETVSDDDEIPF